MHSQMNCRNGATKTSDLTSNLLRPTRGPCIAKLECLAVCLCNTYEYGENRFTVMGVNFSFVCLTN